MWAELTPPYATIVVDPPWPYDDQPAGWQRASGRRTFLPYSHMTLDQIRLLPIELLAAPGAHLYLWTTQHHLWDAKEIAETWGWQVGPVLTWCKPARGFAPGAAWASTTEFVLTCRGKVGSLIRYAREDAGLTIADVARQVRGKEPTGLESMWERDLRWPSQDDWAKLCDLLPVLAERGPLVPAWTSRADSTWFQAPRGIHSEKPGAFLDMVDHVSPGPYVELFARQPRLGWDHWGWGYEQGEAS